jgi:FkbM family methyltransferase
MRSGLRPWSVERCCNHSFIANALGPSAVVIDLGVNTGEFATWMANRFKCVVYGAEPDPDLYGELPRRCDVNVIPCAIGGAAGTAVLRRAVGKCSTLFEGSFRAESSLEVEVLDFEEFLSRAGLAQCNHIDLVKVDIEGAELPMFEDASDALLQRVGQFTVEFHDFVWPELSEQVRCVKARLHSLGFCLVNFSLDNTDVLFLNRKLLGIGRASEAYLRAIKYANGIRRRVGRFLPAMSAYL